MNQQTTHRGLVYRLLPGSVAKARRLAGQAGARRFVWNAILAEQNALYEEWQEARAAGVALDKPSVSFFSLGKRFTKLRSKVERLNESHCATTRYVLKHQADAWQAAFRGDGFPCVHARHRRTPACTIPQAIKIGDNRLHVPKIGWMRWHRKGGNPWPDGRPVRVTIRKQAGKWSASVAYEVAAPDLEDNGVAAGVDMNVGKVAMATSTGQDTIVTTPSTALLETRLKRNQRKLARQCKGSRHRERTKLRMQRLHRKIAKPRKNWQHQTSRKIAATASTVVVEDLSTQGMTQSAKGTLDEPGKNVRSNSGLNRKILKTGWHGLKTMIDYKCREVIAVHPTCTSQTCSKCGSVNARNRTGKSFACAACDHADHADLNAARNIMAFGIGATVWRGALALVAPLTREIESVAACG